MQWLTSTASPVQHFGNVLLAELWELVTEVGAKDTPRSSLKVCFGLSFIFIFYFISFFSFQCLPFARLYTGQCTFCCRTRERIGQTDSDVQPCRLPTVQKKVHSLAYLYAHENKIKGFSKKEESRKRFPKRVSSKKPRNKN